MQQKKVNEIGLRQGLSLSIFVLVFYLISYFFDNEHYMVIGELDPLLLGLMVFFSHRHFKLSGDGSMTFKEGFKMGMIVTGVATLVAAIISYFYLSQIDGRLISAIKERVVSMLPEYKKSLPMFSDEYFESMPNFVGPGMVTMSRVMVALLSGLFFSLAISLFTKKKPNTTDDQAS